MFDQDKLYADWKEAYSLEASHGYTKTTDSDCKAAFLAGRASKAKEVVGLRRALEDRSRRIAEAAKALGFEL